MPARVFFADPNKGSVSSTVLRINREGGTIVGAFKLGDDVVFVATDGNPPCEIRTEQPDTAGGASRVTTEDVIAEAVARWDDPA